MIQQQTDLFQSKINHLCKYFHRIFTYDEQSVIFQKVLDNEFTTPPQSPRKYPDNITWAPKRPTKKMRIFDK